MVKEARRQKALEYLKREIERKKLSKMRNLSYDCLKIQEYLTSDKIYMNRKKIAFKIRTRMLQVNFNFGNRISCPMCKEKDDDQNHLLECRILKDNCVEIKENQNFEINDVFKGEMEKINEITRIINRALKKREEIMLDQNQ